MSLFDLEKLEKNEDGIVMVPNPLERLIGNKLEAKRCPFCTWEGCICTHPLGYNPKGHKEEWKNAVSRFFITTNVSRWLHKVCTLEDAKKCPLLETMPLINWERVTV